MYLPYSTKKGYTKVYNGTLVRKQGDGDEIILKLFRRTRAYPGERLRHASLGIHHTMRADKLSHNSEVDDCPEPL